MILFKHNLVGGKIKPNAMISIMTLDWTEEEKTMKVATIIRNLGIEYELMYKPDLYTSLNIFRNNIYNLRPSIYSSPITNLWICWKIALFYEYAI